MNLAKVSSNGQVTIPKEVRDSLGLKAGDKILFMQKPDGEIVMINAAEQAIYNAQMAFQGAAKEMGIENEDDIQALVDELRR